MYGRIRFLRSHRNNFNNEYHYSQISEGLSEEEKKKLEELAEAEKQKVEQKKKAAEEKKKKLEQLAQQQK